MRRQRSCKSELCEKIHRILIYLNKKSKTNSKKIDTEWRMGEKTKFGQIFCRPFGHDEPIFFVCLCLLLLFISRERRKKYTQKLL